MVSGLATSTRFRALSSRGCYRDHAKGQRGPEDLSEGTAERELASESTVNEA